MIVLNESEGILPHCWVMKLLSHQIVPININAARANNVLIISKMLRAQMVTVTWQFHNAICHILFYSYDLAADNLLLNPLVFILYSVSWSALLNFSHTNSTSKLFFLFKCTPSIQTGTRYSCHAVSLKPLETVQKMMVCHWCWKKPVLRKLKSFL